MGFEWGRQLTTSSAAAVQATGQDLLAHVQAGANGRSLADGPGVKPGAPASALHGLSGIRPEMLAGGDMRLQGRKKKLNESELWEVNQLKKSGVLTVEEQPDFDDEHGFVRAMRLLAVFARRMPSSTLNSIADEAQLPCAPASECRTYFLYTIPVQRKRRSFPAVPGSPCTSLAS